MAHKNNHLVIMAGGVGSRFWPMSTIEKPKQFIDVLGTGRTLLQLTFDRFEGICDPETCGLSPTRNMQHWFMSSCLRYRRVTSFRNLAAEIRLLASLYQLAHQGEGCTCQYRGNTIRPYCY